LADEEKRGKEDEVNDIARERVKSQREIGLMLQKARRRREGAPRLQQIAKRYSRPSHTRTQKGSTWLHLPVAAMNSFLGP
jgi:hypothetical protein